MLYGISEKAIQLENEGKKIIKFNLTKMKFTRPDAPFYVFLKHDGLNSESFALTLLDSGVTIVPSTAFGDYREHFRIALAVPDEEIEFGLKKICEALK